MYSIMVVEDEQIERETLVHIIQKECQPFCSKVLTAKNGKEALTIFAQEHPHIVISDINIPGINGLEVIRTIKQDAEETAFLVVSSYNYFEYAQEAIRLGVKDFILKPYNIQHLVDVLMTMMQRLSEKNKEEEKRSELIDKLNKYTPMMENECLYAIVMNENEFVLKKALHMVSSSISSGFCLVIKAEAYDELYANQIKKGFQFLGLRCIHDVFHGLQIYFVMAEQRIEKAKITEIDNFIQSVKKLQYQYGIGPFVNDIAQFHQSYRMAKKHLDKQEDTLTQLKDNHLVPENEKLDIGYYIQKFLTILNKLDEEGLRNTINQMSLQLICEEKNQIMKEVDIFLRLLNAKLKEQYPQIYFDNSITPFHIIRNIHQEVPLYLHLQLHKLYDPIFEERFKNTNTLVKQAIRYIDANYRKQITLSDMAEHLKISPYYISKLLSSNMNKTFTELVSERRVEASKELLKGNKRIKEIAFEVGFQGQNYFTKVFKNYTGVTPKVYKNTFETKK